jgi:hypothetical protein
MFVSQQTILNVPFPVARVRLVCLARRGGLDSACGQAYADGYTATIRASPFGPVPGASKLVRVRFVEPVAHDNLAVVPLRWEATGTAGRLFPVLLADLTLLPAGGQTKLVLAGTYRPPLDGIGAALDKIVLHHLAEATISSLLRRTAHALACEPPPGLPDEEAGRPDR